MSTYEREILRDFKLTSKKIVQKEIGLLKNELEWIIIMQHYGLPTRLLDWTESHLIALYFAVREFKNQEDGVVWILDGWSLNRLKETLDFDSIPDASHPQIKKYILPEPHTLIRKVEAEYPIAIRAEKNNCTKRTIYHSWESERKFK